jgi:hypothetical protein
MAEKVSKDQFNGSDLYFLKKLHLILLLIGAIIVNTATVAGTYFSLKAEVHANTTGVKELKVKTELLRQRLDKKHDDIIELKINFKNFLETQGIKYIENTGSQYRVNSK